MEIVIGNIFSLLAMVTDSFSSSRKTKRGILLVQCLSQVFYGLCSFVLKGYSGVVQNVVGIARNLVSSRKERNRIVEWILIIMGVALGIVYNNRSFVGLLPVAANLEYSLAIYFFGDRERILKLAFLINAVMFSVFNAYLLNVVGAVSNLVIAVTTLVFLIKERKRTPGGNDTEETQPDGETDSQAQR